MPQEKRQHSHVVPRDCVEFDLHALAFPMDMTSNAKKDAQSVTVSGALVAEHIHGVVELFKRKQVSSKRTWIDD